MKSHIKSDHQENIKRYRLSIVSKKLNERDLWYFRHEIKLFGPVIPKQLKKNFKIEKVGD